MGFWFETTENNNYYINKLTNEKNLGLLISQRMDDIKNKLYTPITKFEGKNCVVFGHPYQIINCDFEQICLGKSNYSSLSLAGTMNEFEVRKRDTLFDDCQIMAAPVVTPIMRNTFVLESAHQCPEYKGNAVYEEGVYIKIKDSEEPLYLSFSSTLLTLGEFNPVKLTSKRDEYCTFKLIFWDPKTRYAKFRTIELNTRIIIQHMATGKNLVVAKSLVPTIFGLEYEVTCNLMRNCHKMETADSYWLIR